VAVAVKQIEKTTKATKAKTKKATKSEAKKFTNCPVCVNGRGMYLNISKHNKRHHGGRTPTAETK
jgi:hypothetical protein